MAFRPRSVKVKKPAATTAPAAAAQLPSTTSEPPSTNAPVLPSAAIPAPPMVPRAIAKRHKVLPNASTSAGALGAATADEPIASTSKALAEVVLDPKEADRLEQLLSAIENCLCDWGLSMHAESGMLQKLRDGKDGYVHIQQLFTIPPIQALAKTQVDILKALRSRESSIISVSETGFQIRRTHPPDFEALPLIQSSDWDSTTLYLENLPTPPGPPPTPYTLSIFLSHLLSTPIQRVVLPPLFDPAHPPTLDPTPSDQDMAFASSQSGRGKKVRSSLPTGGGPFKGFAFVVVGSREDAERVLREWKWENEVQEKEEEGVGEDEEMEDEERPDPGTYGTLAKESGMRALGITRWLVLKSEYLTYHRTLSTLRQTSRSTNSRSRRSPSPPRRPVPSYQVPPHQHSNPSRAAEDPKRRRASSPGRWEKRVRTPSPEEEDEVVEVDARGVYPKGCVVWIRNLHEGSTKAGLKSLFRDVLETLEEGSGKGVEFVDYEKGLDTCHLRLSSSHLSSRLLSHFSSSPSTHLSPTYLSRSSPSASPDPEAPAPDPTRRPVAVQLLEGERERLYWEKLPESTRKLARKSAAGEGSMAQVRKRRKVDVVEEVEKVLEEVLGEPEVVVERPRKKPSKF